MFHFRLRLRRLAGRPRTRSRQHNCRPRLDILEDRCLLSGDALTVFPVASNHHPGAIVAGADGNLWFTDDLSDKIGRISTSGVVNELKGFSGAGMAAGPDGNIWVSQPSDIARVTPAGVITAFAVSGGIPDNITAGPDGNLWFILEGATRSIGRITPDGTVSTFALPQDSVAFDITTGADGNLWFTDGGKIGRLTTAGTLTEFAIPPGIESAHGSAPGTLLADSMHITAGPDGNVWFTQSYTSRIGKITPDGTITEFSLPDDAYPIGITKGPDGNLWYTGYAQGGPHVASQTLIGRISPAGVVSQLVAPYGLLAPIGIVTGPDGNLWIADFLGNIDRLSPDAFGNSASAPMTVRQGDTLAATFSTLTLSPTTSNAAVTVNWGDGQVSQGTVSPGGKADVLAAAASTTYLQPGTYHVLVSLDEGNGAHATFQRLVTVTSNPNAAFVTQLYHDLLRRTPDSAGFGHWLTQMGQGMARVQVAQQFEQSTEYLTNAVHGLYQTLLGRTADPTGLANSLAYLNAGGTLDGVRAALAGSDEYFMKHGGNTAGFLAALYQDLLHRPLDPSGAASWSGLLASAGSIAGARAFVANAVQRSTEALQREVQDAYETFLHRQADTAGLGAFLAALQGGGSAEQIISRIAGSDEYFARLNA